jgi:hypothetical protein
MFQLKPIRGENCRFPRWHLVGASTVVRQHRRVFLRLVQQERHIQSQPRGEDESLRRLPAVLHVEPELRGIEARVDRPAEPDASLISTCGSALQRVEAREFPDTVRVLGEEIPDAIQLVLRSNRHAMSPERHCVVVGELDDILIDFGALGRVLRACTKPRRRAAHGGNVDLDLRRDNRRVPAIANPAVPDNQLVTGSAVEAREQLRDRASLHRRESMRVRR